VSKEDPDIFNCKLSTQLKMSESIFETQCMSLYALMIYSYDIQLIMATHYNINDQNTKEWETWLQSLYSRNTLYT